ncbi:aspartate carbamoyltransferase [Legionella quinlivanii]|uniref:Aspartate carbamoyltransferase n=1 Tax=Legionella quinlivanii TaxID=45073 RepID=A0A0W0XLG6_9GAMM|nr:aspartate carbamoyltransferase catalytic subunit [Legionella quinlivanii]KTD45420.1 aspartate carbamoyltransferase [Legionella quinlivanii]MCW8451292.1 aspartate carbamoyltransferase catalytic subunit [Legionella quinlivanii]SEG34067.1 aspartate carbamoyltransferase [Legionella quinlivanii DSM 21216]STY10511.1 aspartate carbamoyltransferase [Legionella quinlivanii]
MNHFLNIDQLNSAEIHHLLERAKAFKENKIPYPVYSEQRLANLFYENSTRTRVSFEVAAANLSMQVINLDLDRSSESKGEVIEDTIRNLAAMGINLFTIRHSQNFLPQELSRILDKGVHLINAGDGTNEHPTQAMLDLMTILEHKPDLQSLKIALIGNLRHSRVANSLQKVFALVGVKELHLIAPELWQPQTLHFGQATESLREGLSNADVVICLRVQRERLLDNENLDLSTFRRYFALTPEHVKWAKPDAIVMHPGPVNRGVEIDSDIVDGSQSVILQQVRNGVFMRMAVLEAVMNSK